MCRVCFDLVLLPEPQKDILVQGVPLHPAIIPLTPETLLFAQITQGNVAPILRPKDLFLLCLSRTASSSHLQIKTNKCGANRNHGITSKLHILLYIL